MTRPAGSAGSGRADLGDGDGRVRTLDGLRGIAILLILATHLFPNRNYAPSRALAWLNNLAMSGWAGVDLFFVLSGFLITGILLRTKEQPHYFRNFYARRTLRIFPLYYGALAVVFGLLPAIGLVTRADLGPMWDWQGWNWGYGTNIGKQFDDGFGFSGPVLNLAHFWSLAVEEHYYLVWPLVVWLTPARWMAAVCGGAILFAVLFRTVAEFAFGVTHEFYQLTPCRLDGLAAGGLLAVVARSGRLPQYRGRMLAVVAVLGAVLVAAFVYFRCLPSNHWTTHTFGYTLLVGFFVAVVGLSVTAAPGGWTDRLLGSRGLRFFGAYSYGIYVIHGVLSPTLRNWTPADEWVAASGSVAVGSLGCFLARGGVSVGLAILSWHLFEKQFLKFKAYFEYARSPAVVHNPGHSEILDVRA